MTEDFQEHDVAIGKRKAPRRSFLHASSSALSLTVTMSLLALPPAVHGADAERGRLLYENHCVGCHDSRAHIRDDRRAETLTDVRQWVSRWSSTLALGWGESERDDVTEFLFGRYYSGKE